MALFVPLDQGVQVELVFRLAGRILSNRLWFRVVADNPTTTDLTFIGDGVATWAIDNLMPVLSQDIRLLVVRAYDATVAYPGPQVITFAGTDGGFPDGSHSANIAIKMEFFTVVPPGLWWNWNFIGGIPKEGVSLNTIEPTYASALNEAYIVLLDVFNIFIYRWEATVAFENGVLLTTRAHKRIVTPHIRRTTVSQRRTRLDNPS